MREFVEQPASHAPRDIARHMLKFFRAGVTSGIATSIAHPFLPCGYVEQYDAAIAAVSDGEFLDAFGQAAEQDVGLEVTAAFLPSPPESSFSLETPVRFLSLARKARCRFTFGTDAHDPEAQKRLPELMRIVKAVGITNEDVLPL
jgi:histidinol phosphatase-like PHP family hydrolase